MPPGTRYTPHWDQVHPPLPRDQVHPLGPGTPPKPGTRPPIRRLLLRMVRMLLECILVQSAGDLLQPISPISHKRLHQAIKANFFLKRATK